MTKEQHQLSIALALANQNVNALLAELAAKCAEVDTLNARITELEKPSETLAGK